jgi:hypothetical protein
MVGAATGAAVAQPAAPRAEITRADQTLPAGFYPGQGTPYVRRRYPEPFLRFLQRNAATIDEIDQGAAAGRANPSQRHCVGATLSECVSSMAAVIAIASTFSPIDEALEAPLGSSGVDINGRAIEQTPILRAYLGDSDVHLVVLQMNGGQVVGVSLDLRVRFEIHG